MFSSNQAQTRPSRAMLSFPDMQQRAVRDNRVEVRLAAVRALGVLRDPGARRVLALALHDEVGEVRRTAAWALGELRDPRAIPALRAALHDTDNSTRRSMIADYLQVLSRSERALLRAPQRVCDAAAEALLKIGTLEALHAVRLWQHPTVTHPTATHPTSQLRR